MAITDKEQGVWILDEVYNKINQGSIWEYSGANDLFSMGRGNNGLLGLNAESSTSDGRSSPTQVPGNWLGEFCKGNTTDSNTIMFVGKETAGTLWTWGLASSGSNAMNNNVGYSSPVQVGTSSSWAQAWSGGGQMMGTKTDGTLWTCGNAGYGALGHNNVTNRSSPMQLPGSWSTTSGAIAQGSPNNLYAIKSDGSLWSWGRNNRGQLGHDNTDHRSSPTAVGTDTTWSKLAIGGGQNMAAIKTNGTLWSWGYNAAGMLGHNNQTQYESPKQVGTDTTWRTILINNNVAHATKTDGTFWSWGRNLEGQLGKTWPTNTYRSSPVQVGTDTNWSEAHNLSAPAGCVAVKTDGTLWSWGYGNYGMTGQNDRSNYSSPKQVGTATDWREMVGGANSTIFSMKSK